MADKFRYRKGETNPITGQVTTAQAVGLGDMLGQSTGFLYRAEDHAWVDLSTSQFNFAAKFAGVSAQRKVAGIAKPGTGGGIDNRLRVNTEGVFELDTAATTYLVGDLVGPEKQSGNALESQKVAGVSDLTRAIGRVETPKSVASTTTVFVRIFSKIVLGGPQS